MKGLTSLEVQERLARGQVNTEPKSKTKSVKDILLSNIINYFNILNLVLAGIIILSGQLKNVLFLGVIIFNTAIAIFQEIRSKRMIDKLTILSRNKIKVLRDGNITELDAGEIVVDDLLRIETGDQPPVDCLLLEGDLEMDESNLTGESDTIFKYENDEVYSGSVVVSGSAILRVIRVGADSQANQISAQAKAEKIYPSKLRDTMNSILKIVTVAIIPIGILLFLKNKFVFKMAFDKMILKSTAPLVGMIPEGLILLTSVALAVSVYSLAKKNILVQELYCIESLARVDVLCVDKTGTITEGRMEVVEVIGEIEKIMPEYLGAFDYENASDKALIERFGKSSSPQVVSKVDFSSKRKYSAVNFKDRGSYALGAFEFLIKNPNPKDVEMVEKYTNQGLRVLVLAKSQHPIIEKELPEDLKLEGLIVISDVIRENTKELFQFFKKEGVELKIISGDNPLAVGAIAQKAGLDNVRPVDASKLSEEELKESLFKYNVFGRVSPNQKQLMVKELQSKDHIVAMTGDGVNDVLALKSADVSIAMAQGCEAAKQISNIVLLENNFKNLYDILMEGRRVINNIQRVATLFLSKTVMSVIFAILSIFTPIAFPFIPIQLTLISTLTIGVPGFILTLEKSKERIKGNFMKDVLSKAGTSAVIYSLTILILGLVQHFSKDNTLDVMSTMATYLALANGLTLVFLTSRPLNTYKMALVVGFLIAIGFVVIFVPDFFQLVPLNLAQMTKLAIAGAAMITAMLSIFDKLSNYISNEIK